MIYIFQPLLLLTANAPPCNIFPLK